MKEELIRRRLETPPREIIGFKEAEQSSARLDERQKKLPSSAAVTNGISKVCRTLVRTCETSNGNKPTLRQSAGTSNRETR